MNEQAIALAYVFENSDEHGPNRLRGERLVATISVILEGYSLREIEAKTGAAKHTAMRLRKRIEGEGIVLLCACGASVYHKGFCKPRFARCPGRQQFMASWLDGSHVKKDRESESERKMRRLRWRETQTWRAEQRRIRLEERRRIREEREAASRDRWRSAIVARASRAIKKYRLGVAVKARRALRDRLREYRELDAEQRRDARIERALMRRKEKQLRKDERATQQRLLATNRKRLEELKEVRRIEKEIQRNKDAFDCSGQFLHLDNSGPNADFDAYNLVPSSIPSPDEILMRKEEAEWDRTWNKFTRTSTCESSDETPTFQTWKARFRITTATCPKGWRASIGPHFAIGASESLACEALAEKLEIPLW